MNRLINQLYHIANKPSRTIIGLMSGTSLDGLDVAVCRISGSGPHTQLKVLRFETVPYDPSFADMIRRVFARDTIRLNDLSGLHALIGTQHADMVNSLLKKWGITAANVDLIASHGQTVYHAPQTLTNDPEYPNHTLQIGDGDHIAVKTGIITVSDFRQKHVAAGGEGAPLVLYGDYLLYSDEREDRLLLNMGGIANFTFLPSRQSLLAGHAAFATDIGPANTLLNQYVRAHLNKEMDKDAEIASTGTVHTELLQALLNNPFFDKKAPKTTGPELFNLTYLREAQTSSNSEELSHADVLATLCAFSAESIGGAIRHQVAQLPPDSTIRIYASGGGLSNPLLMDLIKKSISSLPVNIASFAQLGLDPDAKEAALFAILANEVVAGQAEHVRAVEGAPAVCMGKISLPS